MTDAIFAFSVLGKLEDAGEREGEGVKYVEGWWAGTEVVEEEGSVGSGNAVADKAFRGFNGCI